MPGPVTEFVGVYDADGTVVGEVGYWVKARLGRAHCALCDITHGLFTRRREWVACTASLPVPFVTYHRDDAPTEVVEAAGREFPAVLVRRDERLSLLLDRARLDALDGSPTALMAALEHELGDQG